MLQADNPKRIAVSRVCFIISAISAAGVLVMLLALIDNSWLRYVVVFVIFGFLGLGLVEMYIVAGHTQKIEPNVPTNPIAAITPITPDKPKTAQLKEPTFTEGIDAISVTVGSIIQTLKIADLQKSKRRFAVGDVPALLYVEGDKPYVDIDIYSPPPLLPVKLQHNRLLNRPSEWDMNSDEGALEVMNEKQQPAFQIFYKSPSQIVVNGLFFNGYVPILASENGLDYGIDLEKELYPIKPIFKYPSSQYKGQRR